MHILAFLFTLLIQRKFSSGPTTTTVIPKIPFTSNEKYRNEEVYSVNMKGNSHARAHFYDNIDEGCIKAVS